MKLDDALKEREDARAEVLGSKVHLSDCKRLEAEAKRQADEALVRHTRARRRFVAAVEALKPLLDADVAGIVGKREESAEDAAAVPS